MKRTTAGNTGLSSLAGCRPAPSSPHEHDTVLRRPEMLQALWFPRLEGEFLTCKSEKALEKDILSNTGIKQLPHEVKVIKIPHSLMRHSPVRWTWLQTMMLCMEYVCLQRPGVLEPELSHLKGPQSSSLVLPRRKLRFQKEGVTSPREHRSFYQRPGDEFF